MCLVVANADLLHQQKEGKSAPPPVVGAMVVLAQPYESRHLRPFDAHFMESSHKPQRCESPTESGAPSCHPAQNALKMCMPPRFFVIDSQDR